MSDRLFAIIRRADGCVVEVVEADWATTTLQGWAIAFVNLPEADGPRRSRRFEARKVYGIRDYVAAEAADRDAAGGWLVHAGFHTVDDRRVDPAVMEWARDHGAVVPGSLGVWVVRAADWHARWGGEE